MVIILKIGYQGIEGSNSEIATLKFVEKLNLNNVEMVPLLDSTTVSEYLRKNKIDYGVMAYKNSITGYVAETKKELDNNDFNYIAKINLPIRHFLYKNKSAAKNDINLIVSHEQALKQTHNSIRLLFQNIKTKEIENTALGAKLLSENKYGNNTAVICSKKAGELYNLECIANDIQDNNDNITSFLLLSKKL